LAATRACRDHGPRAVRPLHHMPAGPGRRLRRRSPRRAVAHRADPV